MGDSYRPSAREDRVVGQPDGWVSSRPVAVGHRSLVGDPGDGHIIGNYSRPGNNARTRQGGQGEGHSTQGKGRVACDAVAVCNGHSVASHSNRPGSHRPAGCADRNPRPHQVQAGRIPGQRQHQGGLSAVVGQGQTV